MFVSVDFHKEPGNSSTKKIQPSLILMVLALVFKIKFKLGLIKEARLDS
jgi:hypothetical protein